MITHNTILLMKETAGFTITILYTTLSGNNGYVKEFFRRWNNFKRIVGILISGCMVFLEEVCIKETQESHTP
jgi:hypothetical protein